MSLMPRRKPPGLKDGCFGPSQYPDDPITELYSDEHHEWVINKLMNVLLDNLNPRFQDLHALDMPWTCISLGNAKRRCPCGSAFVQTTFYYKGPVRILDGLRVVKGSRLAEIRSCWVCEYMESVEALPCAFDFKGVDPTLAFK